MHNDGISRFDLIIFLEQLAVQCLFPLSYLYVYFIYGPQAIRIQNFSLWFQVSNPFGLAANAFHILPWVYFFKAEELKEGGITFAEVAAVMMAGFVFKCMVASKYASLGKAEYLRVLGETNPVAADENMKELQLLTGWLTLDLAHMIHEAELAFARMGLYNGDCETRFRIPALRSGSGQSSYAKSTVHSWKRFAYPLEAAATLFVSRRVDCLGLPSLLHTPRNWICTYELWVSLRPSPLRKRRGIFLFI